MIRMKERNKIKTQLIIVGITLVLLAVGLSGCNGKYDPNPLEIDTGPSQVVDPIMPDEEEEEKIEILPGGIKVTGDIDKVKILDCEVRTELWSSMGGWYKFADGLVVPSENDYNMYTVQHKRKYVVSGTAQNIAGQEIWKARVYIHFYDSDGNPSGGASWYPRESEDYRIDGNTFEFTASTERPHPYSGHDPSAFDSIAYCNIHVRAWMTEEEYKAEFGFP